MPTAMNVATAPRDLELLVKANRFNLRMLAEELGIYDSADVNARNAWLKQTIEVQAERVLKALQRNDKKGGKKPEPERTPVNKKGKKAPPPDDDEEDDEDDGEEVDEDDDDEPTRKPAKSKGKPARKPANDDDDDDDDDEDDEDEDDEPDDDDDDDDDEPVRKPAKSKPAERTPVAAKPSERAPVGKPATTTAPSSVKAAEAILGDLEEIKGRLSVIEDQFNLNHGFQSLLIAMMSTVGSNVLQTDEDTFYEECLKSFEQAAQRIKDLQAAAGKKKKAAKGK